MAVDKNAYNKKDGAKTVIAAPLTALFISA